MDKFDKDEVLSRPILNFDDNFDHKYFIYEGLYPVNQFWDGGKCYLPVRYKQVPHRVRVNIKTNHYD